MRFLSSPVVSVVRLSGVIGASSRSALSLQRLEKLIERAFSPRGLKAVALQINSPGGAPVQSALIAEKIRNLAEKKNVPVLAFCEDVAASGGYWLACSADEIYAHASSIVGSVGVVSAGFGFVDAMKRLGIERRIYTAGKNKRRLDTFLPESKEDVTYLKGIQSAIHRQFVAYVKNRRGARLKREDSDLFEGDFWTGEEAVALGLIDGLGSLEPFVKERFGAKVHLKPVRQKKSWLQEKIPFISALTPVLQELKERDMLTRFGL